MYDYYVCTVHIFYNIPCIAHKVEYSSSSSSLGSVSGSFQCAVSSLTLSSFFFLAAVMSHDSSRAIYSIAKRIHYHIPQKWKIVFGMAKAYPIEFIVIVQGHQTFQSLI